MTAEKLLQLGSRWLKRTSSPQLDAEVLLAHVTGQTRSHLLANTQAPVGLFAVLSYFWLLGQAWRGTPIAYLTGEREFYGRTFKVTKATLVPRPETELLVNEVITTIHAHGSLGTVVDIGAGSGCIAITLALELPRLKVYAGDVSPRALTVARSNTLRYGLGSHLHLLCGNLLEPFIQGKLLTPTTLVVANLPYLRPAEYSGGLRFEPRGALVGGADGLALYRRLIMQLNQLSPAERPKWMVLELHPPTAAHVVALVKNTFPSCHTELRNDLSGRPRVLNVQLT